MQTRGVIRRPRSCCKDSWDNWFTRVTDALGETFNRWQLYAGRGSLMLAMYWIFLSTPLACSSLK